MYRVPPCVDYDGFHHLKRALCGQLSRRQRPQLVERDARVFVWSAIARRGNREPDDCGVLGASQHGRRPAGPAELTKQRATRLSERRVGPATHNVVSPVPTRCHQLSPHISCAGCAITNHSESSRMSHLRKSPLYRRQGWPRPGGHNHQSRPQERRLNTGSRLYRAMLAPAAAPPRLGRTSPGTT